MIERPADFTERMQETRQLAREMYALGNSLAVDLQEWAASLDPDLGMLYTDSLVRAFLTAWVLEDAQPASTSTFKNRRMRKTRS